MGQEFQQAIVLVENIHAFSRHAAGAGDAIRQNTRCNIRMGGQRRGSSHSGKRQAGSLILRQAEPRCGPGKCVDKAEEIRSEEHKSELHSLMRISYAIFRLTKKKMKHKK